LLKEHLTGLGRGGYFYYVRIYRQSLKQDDYNYFIHGVLLHLLWDPLTLQWVESQSCKLSHFYPHFYSLFFSHYSFGQRIILALSPRSTRTKSMSTP